LPPLEFGSLTDERKYARWKDTNLELRLSVGRLVDDRLLVGPSMARMRWWNAATGEQLAVRRHDAGVYSVSWSPDGKYVISGSADKSARVWDGGRQARKRFLGTFIDKVFFRRLVAQWQVCVDG